MSETAKYHNKLNEISFRNFNSVELNIFFSICSQMKERGLAEITFSFEELRILSEFSRTSNSEFVNLLRKVYKKMLNLVYQIESDNGDIEYFVLFTNFKISPSNKTVDIQVNKKFDFILNKLTSNFTVVELEEFTNLKSSYSKNMYRLLKQWKSIGKYHCTLEEFKKWLDIPQSYKIGHINDRVLKPINKELPTYFKGLAIEKKRVGRGGKIDSLTFTWQAETKSDRRKKTSQKTFRQETLPDWAEAETPPKPTLIALEDYTKLAEQMTRLGQSIEPYDLIEERYQAELHEWLKKWAKS